MVQVRTRWAATAAALTLMAVSGCGASSTTGNGTPGVTDKQITVGTTNPLTGVIAATCKPVTDGSQAWFDKVNADGGVNGRTIAVNLMDDAYDATKSLANARQLADEGIFAYFGGCGSIEPPSIISVAQKQNIPYLFNLSAVPDVIKNPLVRSIDPPFADQSGGAIEYALKKGGPGKVYILIGRLPGFEATSAATVAGIKAAGGTVAGEADVVVGKSDMDALAVKIKATGAEYLATSISPSEVAKLLLALKARDALPTKYVTGSASLLTAGFLSSVGDLVDGKVIAPVSVAPASSPDAKDCVAALDAAKVTVETTSLQGCSLAQAFVESVRETKDLTRMNILATIDSWKDKQVSSALPKLTYSADRHIGPSDLFVLGLQGGKIVQLEGTIAVVGQAH